MSVFDYFLQKDDTQSLRRYPTEGNRERGHRWDRSARNWTCECADRRSCELTGDKMISEEEALARL